MEKQIKFKAHVGSYSLLQWSCILLRRSQFASISSGAHSRVASAQASLISFIMQGSFRQRRACKRLFNKLFIESLELYRIFVGELQNGRISYKDSPEVILLLLEFLSGIPSLLNEFKSVFLELYAKAVLNAREKPERGLSEAFHPLFRHITHEEFPNAIIPSAVKMLKRNPEILLESVGILLESVNVDLSMYTDEIVTVVLPQARHADEKRRIETLNIIKFLSQKSSNPDSVEAMFNAVKSVIGGL